MLEIATINIDERKDLICMRSGYVLNTSNIAARVALFNFNVDVLCSDSEGSARYLSVIPTTTIDSSLITRCGTYRVEQEIFEKKI